jgi:hypothetical protein
MGVGYRLDEALGLSLVVFDGKVTGDEWRTTVLEVFADPRWPPGRLNLTDLRTADTSALTESDRAEIFAINALHADKLVRMKSASLGSAHFDATRRFERDDHTSGLRIIAFDDLAPACDWLGVDVERVRTIIEELRVQLREPKPRT